MHRGLSKEPPSPSPEPLRPSQGEPELRCGCGSLLARYVAGAVELKCRRCKRVLRIPVEASH
jgi:hypothetical protein